jgi:hypothetical protein
MSRKALDECGDETATGETYHSLPEAFHFAKLLQGWCCHAALLDGILVVNDAQRCRFQGDCGVGHGLLIRVRPQDGTRSRFKW